MPIVNIKLIEGRSDEQLKGLVKDVTEAVHQNAKAPKENIHVIIEEMKPEHYGVAGT
ncbi:MAG TPA: 4-oxalocrotonate tautomerase, partial [Staphylococcus sp.]|nr:4-oxalocrotonate tautomerase [Staphylococcus sp.]